MVTSYLIQPLVFASLSSVLMTCYFSQFLPPLAVLQNNNKQRTKTDNLFHQTNSKKKKIPHCYTWNMRNESLSVYCEKNTILTRHMNEFHAIISVECTKLPLMIGILSWKLELNNWHHKKFAPVISYQKLMLSSH